jgi:lantibiotic modifying enzyme
MLLDLPGIELRTIGNSELAMVCDVGARYALAGLETSLRPKQRACLGKRAKQSLRNNVRRGLMRITRPCFELERRSHLLAVQALGMGYPKDAPRDKSFAAKSRQRLLSMLERFPVLADLWSQSIAHWQRHIKEVLVRLTSDRPVLSRVFGIEELAKLTDIQAALSEPHHGGRTVVQLVLGSHPLIYKPRSGDGEWEWNALLKWMNQQSLRPAARPVTVLRRPNYCWMEFVQPAPCRNKESVRRYFQRMGELIALAYILKAVDCHRDNLIAAGEWPVLIDTDTLWHVSKVTKTQSLSHVLYRTGFFPNSRRRSLQSRSSVLGPAMSGSHLACWRGGPVRLRPYAGQIVKGFRAGWRCLLGTRGRRASLDRRVRRIRSRKRRWIYRATATYADFARASIQPAVLRSSGAREVLIRELCQRRAFDRGVLEKEIKSLLKLDIPYFTRRTTEWMPADKATPPDELIAAIRQALRW